MNQIAASYARVSSDRQKEQQTIGSQRAALFEYAQAHQYTIAPEWQFEDDGYSGGEHGYRLLQASSTVAFNG